MAIEVTENEALAPWTTLGLGGTSRYYAPIRNENELSEALAFAERERLDWMVLGGGSNVVIGDGGFGGLTIHMRMRGISAETSEDAVHVEAKAGEPWDAFVAHCTERGWAGLECLSGIPGLVGASPIQNVGAYGQEVSETIAGVRVYDALRHEVREWSPEACEFGYRDSIFKRSTPGRYVVLSVRFRLRPGGEPTIVYGELARALEERSPKSPDLKTAREAVVRLRRSKAMVIDPDDPDTRSAGSFFTNPVVSDERAKRLGQLHAAMPRFAVTASDGSRKYKLAAAWLIEHAGFEKGFRQGNVGISSKHALALINAGGGSSRELLALAQQIRLAVFKVFEIVLEPEPQLVGCSLPPL